MANFAPEYRSLLFTALGFHLWPALPDQPLHGSGIRQEAAIMTHVQVAMGPGMPDCAMKCTLKGDLIEKMGERPDQSLDDERYCCFRLTDLPTRTLAAEVQRLSINTCMAQVKRIPGRVEAD